METQDNIKLRTATQTPIQTLGLEESIGTISRFNSYLGAISRLQINNIAKTYCGKYKTQLTLYDFIYISQRAKPAANNELFLS